MQHRTPLSLSRGITLVELMVGVAILAILLSLGVPSFNATRNEMQRDSAARAFLAHVQLARSEAIKTSRTVTMCVRATATTCAAGNDWSNGWLVYVTLTNVLVDQGSFQGLTSMASNSGSMTFLPNGMVSSGANTITVKANNSNVKDYQITVNTIGRAAAKEL